MSTPYHPFLDADQVTDLIDGLADLRKVLFIAELVHPGFTHAVLAQCEEGMADFKANVAAALSPTPDTIPADWA